ncbi:MAG: DNA alkylation repair protein [Candidatus Planktophila sp.]
MSAIQVKKELQALANRGKAHDLQKFFQTAPGQYGEGDIFLGLAVPHVREIAKKYKELSLQQIEILTRSEFHEVRLCGLVILTIQYKGAKERKEKKKIFDLYMKALYAGDINNWDLVDVTAPIIGAYLIDSKDPYVLLFKLAKSKSLWQRRVSMVFTFAFIRAGEIEPTFEMAEKLLHDKHDLIHKAVGWALREAGKLNGIALRDFLSEHSHEMPRTMLRYSIEKFPERERKKWLLDSKYS